MLNKGVGRGAGIPPPTLTLLRSISMNMYRADEEFIKDLKEWCKNNPFNPKDYSHDIIPTIPSPMKGQAPWNKGLPNTWGDKTSKTMKGVPRKYPKQMAAASKNATIRNTTMYKCVYCNMVNNLGNHKRYHDIKCKLFTSLASHASY